MAKRIDWGLVAPVAVLALFLGLLLLGALASDSSDWTPINEDCVLNVEIDRRLFGQTETREIYCASDEAVIR